MGVTRRGAWGAGALLLVASAAFASGDDYEVLLAQTVRDDGIDYAALAAGREALDDYVRRLAAADPGATDPDRIAFWINAFNALALQQAIDAPAGTRTWKVALRDVTLDGIVEILKGFGEPLVHFALHRPARSSPPLSAALYQGRDLAPALLQQARTYLGDPTRNLFEYAQLRAELSMLLLWHREEFEKGRQGDVPPLQLFLADHLPNEADPATGGPVDGAIARSLRKTHWSISFRPWDGARDDAKGAGHGVHPAWMALYAAAAGGLLVLGFRALRGLLLDRPPPAPSP